MSSSNQSDEYSEKRQHIRRSCQTPAEVYIGAQRYPGYIRNESKGGIYVLTRGSFFAGDDVTVVYESPTGFGLKKTGKIVAIKLEGIGIKFSHPGYNR
jgi:hypothetical protein